MTFLFRLQLVHPRGATSPRSSLFLSVEADGPVQALALLEQRVREAVFSEHPRELPVTCEYEDVG